MLQIPFRVDAPDIDETRRRDEAPDAYVVRLARAKAEAVAARAPGDLVLAADTTVTLDDQVFEKPRTPDEAGEFLRRLSGRTHRVMTAVAVAQDARLEDALDVTAVTFRTLSERIIADYVATGESMDKAGGYATQGMGAALVERIDGDFFGVMGLPLRLALDLLERFGRPYRFTR
jgi:septum formation protein